MERDSFLKMCERWHHHIQIFFCKFENSFLSSKQKSGDEVHTPIDQVRVPLTVISLPL